MSGCMSTMTENAATPLASTIPDQTDGAFPPSHPIRSQNPLTAGGESKYKSISTGGNDVEPAAGVDA